RAITTGPDDGDLGSHPHAQLLGSTLDAGAAQQRSHPLLVLGLAVAGRALVEVLSQPVGIECADLRVQVLLELGECFLALAVLVRPLDHRPSLTMPRSRAWSASNVRSWRRPR